MIIAARLRERMEAQNISQAELARLVGVAQPSIFKLLNGDSQSTRHLHRIARELFTTPAFLTGETDDPTSDFPDDRPSADEREILQDLRKLTERDRAAARQLIRSLAECAPESTPSTTLHAPPRSFSRPGQSKGRAA